MHFPLKIEKLGIAAGFSIVHLEVLDEEFTFEKWLYPVKPGGVEEKVIRAEFAKASAESKNLIAVREDSGKVLGWTKSRIVLVAGK